MLRTIDEAKKTRCWQWATVMVNDRHMPMYEGVHPLSIQPFCTASDCMAWEAVGDKGYCSKCSRPYFSSPYLPELAPMTPGEIIWTSTGSK